MGKLTSILRERSALQDADVAAMARLFDRYYDGATPGQFKQDLAGKTHVIELRDGDALCGFSPLCVYDLQAVAGRPGPIVSIRPSASTISSARTWSAVVP